jgi:hypothetical protein
MNWCNAPAYKLAKYVVQILNHTIQLPNSINTKNSINLTEDLNNITIDKTIKIRSFDTENMYSNTPHKNLQR